jgi:hypothetical protein
MKLMDDVHVPARLHKLGFRAALIAFSVTLVAALAAGPAEAAPKMTVLGAAAPANPSCPDGCQAIGKTTGFQAKIGETKKPFEVPYPGRLVAWSIKLGSPNESQIDFFKQFYGGDPKARVSVLKPIKSRKGVYKLKSQSPVEELLPFLGSTTTFTLQSPLKVNTGQIVALTSETWVPAFAINLPQDTAWRASRKKGKCTKPDDIKAGSPQATPGKDRVYGCQYKTARLLYSATVVRAPGAKKKKKPSNQ